MELDNSLTDFIKSEPGIDEVCAALVALNIMKGELSIVYDGLAHVVSQIMDQEGEVALADGSKVEKKWSSDRKGWQHRDLASAVASRLIQSSIDMDTGEVLYTQEEIIGKILDFVQPSYWRVKELQKIGINADMYCEVGETKSSIIVRKAK